MTPENWPDFFVSVALRSLLLAGAGTLFYLAVRRGSNRLRFGAAVATIGSLVLLPIFLGMIPKIQLGLVPAASTEASSTLGFDWKVLLVVAWLAGTALFLFRLIRASIAAYRLKKRSTGFTSKPAQEILHRLRQRLEIQGPVRIAMTREISRPVVCGLFHPAILLPPQASGWSRERIERVLAHELAHLARRDLWTQWLCQVVTAIYWFNPLVWRLASWQIREREIAADELALSVTDGNRSGYARELLAIAIEPSAGTSSLPMPSAAAMLGATSKLEDRIVCLFASGSENSGPARLSLALACTLAITIFAACTACDPVGSRQGDPWTEDEVQLRLSADPFPGP